MVKKWVAQIHKNGKRIYIGTYNSVDLAHEAYLKEKRTIHPGCTI